MQTTLAECSDEGEIRKVVYRVFENRSDGSIIISKLSISSEIEITGPKFEQENYLEFDQ